MQHGLLALQRLDRFFGVADVTLDHAQIRMVRQPAAEEQLIINGDVVAFEQQPGVRRCPT